MKENRGKREGDGDRNINGNRYGDKTKTKTKTRDRDRDRDRDSDQGLHRIQCHLPKGGDTYGLLSEIGPTKAKTEMETETKAAKEEEPSFMFIWAS